MSAPSASIVIPVWDRPSTLGRAIRSVLSQTRGDLEVIVVDNGSADAAAVQRVIDEAKDDRVRLVRLGGNTGPSGGRNAGVAASSARLIGFLDSDDEFEPEWFEEMSAPFDDPGCSVVTCGYRIFHADGRIDPPANPEPLSPAFHGVCARFQAGTMLIRRDAFDAAGGFDPVLWFGENTDLGLSLTAQQPAPSFHSVPRALLRWHHWPKAPYAPELRMASAQRTLERHAGAMSRDPQLRRSYLAVAGVSAARAGQRATARRCFAQLARDERSLRAVARWVVALTPLTSRLVWGRQRGTNS